MQKLVPLLERRQSLLLRVKDLLEQDCHAIFVSRLASISYLTTYSHLLNKEFR
jgi:hypothetical protein